MVNPTKEARALALQSGSPGQGVIAWRVYYGDGSTFSGEPEQAPARNVQVIAQLDPDHGWQHVSGTDYYVWRDGRWFGVDRFGLYDYLVDSGWKVVLFGRMLTADEYNAVWRRVKADPDLPEKTGFAKWERRPK